MSDQLTQKLYTWTRLNPACLMLLTTTGLIPEGAFIVKCFSSYKVTSYTWPCVSGNLLKFEVYGCTHMYSVMQSDRNSLKTDTFYKPTSYEPHVQTSFEEKITFSRNDYGQVGVFRIKMRSLVQKLQPLEKCQFFNCSHLIASHCKVHSLHWRCQGTRITRPWSSGRVVN